ncbi:MAG: hypothetical protein ABW352_20150 [Polyangiales bacterium]
MERFLDDIAVPLRASPERTWDALLELWGRDALSPVLARVLGCSPSARSSGWSGAVGDTLPGFGVRRAEPGRLLELHGRHRFATYTLVFELASGKLHARSYADFPGVGVLYRALVVGSGGHALVVGQMLRRVVMRSART